MHLRYVILLRCGRLLLACTNNAGFDHQAWRGTYTRVGRTDGYDRWSLTGVTGGVFKIHVFASDDLGQSWQGGDEPIDTKPLVWAYAAGRFIEQDDGIVVLTAYGCQNDEDTGGRTDCCGLFRSTDGGKTWGDFTRIAYDESGRDVAYNELDIQPMPDGTWVAAIRTEWRSMAGGYASCGSVAFSSDQGRSWTRPELMFPDTGFDLALLPDGGLAYGLAGFRKVVFSYDGGHTWSREIDTPTDKYTRLELLADDELLVYAGWGGHRGFLFRRIPAN